MDHSYSTRVIWTGNTGSGTATYGGYARSWDIAAPGKPVVSCSNDPLLGGDPTKMNPEDLLLSALAACHMLWYLHFAAEAGVVVVRYVDSPVGVGTVGNGGAGQFTAATLRPHVTVKAGTDLAVATALHGKIGAVCFIARSVNFPVHHAPRFSIEG
ncbi:OsmC family protein [Ketogulonicigenium robustum]|uniref:OsmC family protein n=1 Tax=Ketogulonicigenium robustum TaxID=92947 RepID=UPI0012F4E94F|nr:OsmC family protein [Ketogulonicigenium robustum]